MTETEFIQLAETTLRAIEAAFDQAMQEDSTLDIECSRSGNVLQIELVANGAKIIINSQAAMQEMWVAAKSGGFHYQFNPETGNWNNTRDRSELFAALSQLASEQAGQTIVLRR